MTRILWLSAIPIAGIAWMTAVAYYEYQTLVATGISALYALPLLIFAPTALKKPWVQIISALPLFVVLGALAACAFWALFIIV